MLKNKSNSLDYICNEVITKCKTKYNKYSEYLNKDFYDNLFKELPRYYDQDMGISLDVSLMITANRLIIKELSSAVKKNDEIEIELMLLEDYQNIIYVIMMKLGYTSEQYKKYGEDILLEAIETYDGEKTFSQYILKCVRNFKNNDKKHDGQVTEKEKIKVLKQK